MNTSYRLNTCKSRGTDIGSLLPIGVDRARVSNAYPTCPPLGDNLAKVRLIPNDVSRRHLKEIKDLSVMDGDASD